MTEGSDSTPALAAHASSAAASPTLDTVVEALLFVSADELSAESLATAAGAPTDEVLAALERLADRYLASAAGIRLHHYASGWRLTTAAECAPVLERFVVEGQSARLSQAALESLAIIAYRQPISRGRIAAIRGVAVEGVVRTLMSRGLVEQVAVEDSGASLLGTTATFLNKLGINDLTELPTLVDLLPELSTLDAEAAEPQAATRLDAWSPPSDPTPPESSPDD